MTMEAGRELDALIAEKVMGLLGVHQSTEAPYWWMYTPAYGLEMVPEYSTDIADAWQVMEKLRDSYDPCIGVYEFGSGLAGWFCDLEGISAHAETAPLAICRAALAATGVDAE